MKKAFWFWKRTVSAALALASCMGVASVGASAAQSLPVVSYGISVLAAQTDMAVSGFAGNDIVFCEEDFRRGLNLSHVDYITVCTLPLTTEGELLLGSSRVAAGQSIAGENLSHLCFAAASDDVTQASFTFTANGSATPIVCKLYAVREPNSAPTLSMAPDLSLTVSTYRDLCAYGMLSAYDPEGDEMVFEIVSYPQNGSIRMSDRTVGTYVYTPNESYTGRDCFSYVARDRYGNYSAARTVNLSVDAKGTQVTYVDMERSPTEYAALAVTEAGIMSGSQIGNRYYFYPERTVSRVEFLVMAMNAAGITDIPACDATDFGDDSSIPTSMKGYVDAAYSMGYVSGTNVLGELCFLPDEEITVAEAAVIVDAVLGLGGESSASLPTLSSNSDIPVWARESVSTLASVGILVSADGSFAVNEKITRGETATILAAVMAYLK